MIPRPEISAWRRDSLDETIEAKRLLRTYATLAAQQLELSLIELKAPDRGGDRDGISVAAPHCTQVSLPTGVRARIGGPCAARNDARKISANGKPRSTTLLFSTFMVYGPRSSRPGS
jgi:hypothetical protein